MGEPWLMRMEWHDLAFLHWRLDPVALRAVVPHQLELDLFEGHAWLGIVPFRMQGVRPRWLPPIPGASRFLELNVRTYVRSGGSNPRPGVWFFSLDAESPPVVAAARRLLHLPYFHARMDLSRQGELTEFTSRRTHSSAPTGVFRASFGWAGTASDLAEAATPLERFLVERYCLYALDPRGHVMRTDIAHRPWRIGQGKVEIREMDMTRLVSLELPDLDPIVHVAAPLAVRAWRPRRVAAHTHSREEPLRHSD
jgi:uncharacterized protein